MLSNVLKRMNTIVQNSQNSVNKFFVPEDTHCSETNLILILTVVRFSVYDIWLILLSKFPIPSELGT